MTDSDLKDLQDEKVDKIESIDQVSIILTIKLDGRTTVLILLADQSN
jgi:2,3-bisphosphoglycerate-independent phosphoglycerate mutase